MRIKREHTGNKLEQTREDARMAAIIKNVSAMAPRTLIEDALGLAAVCVIIIAGFCLPAFT